MDDANSKGHYRALILRAMKVYKNNNLDTPPELFINIKEMTATANTPKQYPSTY